MIAIIKVIILILSLIAQSALYTDSLQTRHWVAGTLEEPIGTPSGRLVYETNPILAGRPEMVGPYFQCWSMAVEAASEMLSPPLAIAFIGWVAFEDGRTVIRNNELSAQNGLPQYWGLSYRWRF